MPWIYAASIGQSICSSPNVVNTFVNVFGSGPEKELADKTPQVQVNYPQGGEDQDQILSSPNGLVCTQVQQEHLF